MPSKCKTVACPATLFCVGLFVLGAACAVISFLPTLVRNQVMQESPLRINGTTTKMWLNPPYKTHMEFWLFNFTNAEQFFDGLNSTPILAQTGPYRFIEVQSKHAEFFNNDTIKYRSKKQFFLDKEWMDSHNMSLDDEIVTVNVPLMTAYNLLDDSQISEFLKAELRILLRAFEHKPYVRKTVRELLLEGYDDPLFKAAHLFLPQVPARMGFFYGKNDSDDGVWEVKDGVGDVAELGRIISWKGKEQLSFWHTNQTNMINGTDGTLYPPFITRSSKPRIFVADLCRSMILQYKRDVTVKGIPALQFELPFENFAADQEHPQNAGFCQHTTDMYFDGQLPNFTYDGVFGYCLPSGLLNVSACQNNAPIVTSLPHFLYAPKYVQDSVAGLDPGSVNSDEHQTVIVIEPTTGAGVHFQRKLQINVAVAPRDGSHFLPSWITSAFRLLSKVPAPKIIPVVWLNESAVIDDASAKMLYDKLLRPQIITKDLCYFFIVLGCLLMLLGVGIAIFVWNKGNSDKDDEISIIREDNETGTEDGSSYKNI